MFKIVGNLMVQPLLFDFIARRDWKFSKIRYIRSST
jgi:hypothetical protein